MLNRPQTLLMALLMTAGNAGLAYSGQTAAMPEIVPPNPVAGQCYARVKIPAQYRNDDETVVVEEGHEVLDVTEPHIRSRQEQVLVKEASVHYKVRQPTFRTITENMVVRPAYERLEVTPPRMSTVTETVAVSSPRLVWKQGNPEALRAQGYIIHSTADAGAGGRGYRSTVDYGRARTGVEPSLCGNVCEVWCLVEEPGESVSFNRKVVSSEGSVKRVMVPAKVRAITKQVVADPGGVQEIPVPAKYQTVTVEDVVGESRVTRHAKPPVYGAVAKRVLVSPERYEWRAVACRPGQAPQRLRQNAPLPRVAPRGQVTPHPQIAPHRQIQPAIRTAPIRTGQQYYHGTNLPVKRQNSQPVRHRATGTLRTHTRQAPARIQGRTYGSQSPLSSYRAPQVNTHTSSYQASSYQTAPHKAQPYRAELYQSHSGPAIDQVSRYDPSLPTYSEDYTKPPVTHPLDRYESRPQRPQYRRWNEE